MVEMAITIPSHCFFRLFSYYVKASYGFTIFQVKSPEYNRVSTMFSTTFSRYFSPKAYKNCVECSNIQLNCTDLIGNFNSTVERCHFEFIHSLVRIFTFPLPFLQCTFSILIEHFCQEVTILSRLGLQRQMVISMNHRVFAPPPIYGKYVIIFYYCHTRASVLQGATVSFRTRLLGCSVIERWPLDDM